MNLAGWRVHNSTCNRDVQIQVSVKKTCKEDLISSLDIKVKVCTFPNAHITHLSPVGTCAFNLVGHSQSTRN